MREFGVKDTKRQFQGSQVKGQFDKVFLQIPQDG